MHIPVALITNESEYIILLYSLQDCILFIPILEDIKKISVKTLSDSPKVYYKVLDYCSGSLELANMTRLQPLRKNAYMIIY